MSHHEDTKSVFGCSVVLNPRSVPADWSENGARRRISVVLTGPTKSSVLQELKGKLLNTCTHIDINLSHSRSWCVMPLRADVVVHEWYDDTGIMELVLDVLHVVAIDVA